MKFPTQFSDLRFASKMFVLTGVLAVLAVAMTVYALSNMRAVNQQYRSLIAHEAQGALTIAEAARHLDGASRLAYTVLTEPDELRMLALLGELGGIKRQYDVELHNLSQVLPTKAEQIKEIALQSERLFQNAELIIKAASRWRGDQALQIIHREFEPSLRTLRGEMDALRDGAISQFKTASADLSQRTAKTIVVTASAVVGAFALVIPLSIFLVITQVSRPFSQLTRTMLRMSERHFDDAIALTKRGDELGQMANALQVFQRSMQREDRLAVELQASTEARRLSEQLVDLISAIPGAVFQIRLSQDGRRTILFASERAAHLHGRSVAELQRGTELAGHEFQLASEEAMRSAHDAFAQSARTLDPLNFDTQITDAGKTRWIKTLSTARRAPDGGTLFNGVWLDVTEQKEQAQALHEAKELAERTGDDKARFLATMSHEIRTPLNAMLGMTQLAMRHESEPIQLDRLEKAMRAGRHLLGIVNDVLDISKIEAGKLEIQTEDFALRPWLAELAELLSAEAQAKGLRLEVQVEAGTPQLIRADRQRMSQILINFVNNAIKFTTTGGVTIAINASEPSARSTLLTCSVTDTGMGIADSDQAALFTAFSQADSSITRRFGGTGLGLAISRELAVLMGGTAGVRSAPGEGSTFWFTARVALPQTPEGGWDVADSRLAPAFFHGPPYRGPRFAKGVRLLLVDDNELNRAVARGMLEMTGIAVDEACNGADAVAMLEAAEDGTYCLVLMDMQMPTMDGLTATRAIRERSRFTQLPVVALTANASDADVARTRTSGMNDHLSKPLMEEMLWACLQRWVSPVLRALPTSVQFDAPVMHELRGAVGEARTGALASAFLRDAEQRLARMQAIAAKARPLDWSALSAQAHGLSGSAGSFGLARLGSLAHELSAVVDRRDEAAARRAMERLLECGHVDLAALRQHCEMGAEPGGNQANV